MTEKCEESSEKATTAAETKPSEEQPKETSDKPAAEVEAVEKKDDETAANKMDVDESKDVEASKKEDEKKPDEEAIPKPQAEEKQPEEVKETPVVAAAAPTTTTVVEEEEEEEESEWEEDGGEIEVEEFYVKYKNLSYLHCEWKSRDELFYSDKRIDQKIKRFKLKKQQTAQMYDWEDEGNADGYNNDYDELFNPDYVEIDRVLDEYEIEDTTNTKSDQPPSKVKYFLIKWKSLPYEDASWEIETDVKNAKKIERFHRFNTMVPEMHQRIVPRPKPDK